MLGMLLSLSSEKYKTIPGTTLNTISALGTTRTQFTTNKKWKILVKCLFLFSSRNEGGSWWWKEYLRNPLDAVSDTQLAWTLSNTGFSRLCSLSMQVPTCSLQGLFLLVWAPLLLPVSICGTKEKHRLMTLSGCCQLYGWDLKGIDGLLFWLAWKAKIQSWLCITSWKKVPWKPSLFIARR